MSLERHFSQLRQALVRRYQAELELIEALERTVAVRKPVAAGAALAPGMLTEPAPAADPPPVEVQPDPSPPPAAPEPRGPVQERAKTLTIGAQRRKLLREYLADHPPATGAELMRLLGIPASNASWLLGGQPSFVRLPNQLWTLAERAEEFAEVQPARLDHMEHLRRRISALIGERGPMKPGVIAQNVQVRMPRVEAALADPRFVVGDDDHWTLRDPAAKSAPRKAPAAAHSDLGDAIARCLVTGGPARYANIAAAIAEECDGQIDLDGVLACLKHSPRFEQRPPDGAWHLVDEEATGDRR